MGKPVPSAPPELKLKAGKGNWRDKYRGSASEDTREQTCIQFANQWQVFLVKMARDIKKMEPDTRVWFDESQIRDGLYPSMVLTVDKFLPDGFEVGPEVTASIGTTSVLVQRWLVGRRAAKLATTNARDTRTAAQYVSKQAEKVVNQKPETPEQERDAAIINGAMKMGEVPADYQGPM
jgi:hypothetical protein